MLLVWGSDIYLIKANDLTCVRQKRQLFAPISFELTAGEMLLIQGANGSGKSSLLRLLSGIATPESGDVYWQGQSIYAASNDYAEHIHYLGHANGLKSGLSILENLELANQLNLHQKHAHSTIAKTPEDWLAQFHLTQHIHTITQYLSAGQKRRVALMKCFLFPKPLWILDEPLTSLDMEAQALFLNELQNHLKTGGIAMMSSHHTTAFPDAKRMELSLC